MVDSNLMFLNHVTKRVGPSNALGLMKDSILNAFRQLFEEAGISKQRIDQVVEDHLRKTAQTVMSMPSPSPYQPPITK